MLALSVICHVAIRADWMFMTVPGLLALPVFAPAALAARALGLAGWSAVVVVYTSVWLESYALVRVAEWRRELKGTPSLRIT
jgi:hypothetical protein